MINTERIVPVTATDLISLYGVILKLNSSFSAITALQADTADGHFTVNESGMYLAAEPVKTIDFGAEASSAMVIMVPAYDFAGFTAEGEAITPVGTAIEADGRTLYQIQHTGSGTTVSKIGF